MKKLIADLLLIAGVITASIAAAESRRVSKTVSLDDDLRQEVLHSDVSSRLYAQHPENYVYADQTLAAGTVLDAESVAWLKTAAALSSVSVLRQRESSEPLPVLGEAAIGRVLAAAVILGAELEEAKGRIIDANFIERLEAADLETVKVSYKPTAAQGAQDGAKEMGEPLTVEWSFAEDAQNPEGLELVGCRLEQKVMVPIRLKASTFLDAPTLQRLADSGHETVSVKIPTKFAWQNWGMRWTFVAGALLTLFGVFLKRSKASGAELEADATHVASLAAELMELEEGVSELLERAASMDAEALHAAVDPLLIGPAYRFAEGRESIRTAHGMGAYIAVMDAFARGERKLNRTWSAAVDGYAGEARASLAAALPALREAREALPGTARPARTAAAGLADADGGLRIPPDVPQDLE